MALEVILDTPVAVAAPVAKVRALRTIVNHEITDPNDEFYAQTSIQFLGADGSVVQSVVIGFTSTELAAWNDDDNYLLQQAYAKLQAQGLI